MLLYPIRCYNPNGKPVTYHKINNQVQANNIYRESVSYTHLKELAGSKAVGMDEITKREYERNLEQNIDDLVESAPRRDEGQQAALGELFHGLDEKVGVDRLGGAFVDAALFPQVGVEMCIRDRLRRASAIPPSLCRTALAEIPA